MHPEVREALKVLRRHARNARRRKSKSQPRWTFDYESNTFQLKLYIDRVDEVFKRIDRLERLKKQQAAREKESRDKTAGRNFLQPRLGR